MLTSQVLAEQIGEEAEQCREELVQFRHELHQRPELSMEEYKTSHKIAEELRCLKRMEVITDAAGGTGVTGTLKGTEGLGKTILLQADVGALPIGKKTGLPYASETAGVMHACGYDNHAARLLGSAMILSRLRSRFPGNVEFVFQPGEENGFGGKKMIEEDHILENPAVDAVFAVHAWPGAAAEESHVAKRYTFGYPGNFEIQVTGRGGRSSWPHECVDPIAVANQVYSGLQQIVSRCPPEIVPRILSVCTTHPGPQDKRNITPDCCTMTGTLRVDKLEVIERMENNIKRIVQGVVVANGAFARVTIGYGRTVINSPDTVLFCLQSAAGILGEEYARLDTKPHPGGEDFSGYVSHVPGAYVYVGIATEKNNGTFGLHGSNSILEGSMIPKMAAVFAQLAVDFLEKGGP